MAAAGVIACVAMAIAVAAVGVFTLPLVIDSLANRTRHAPPRTVATEVRRLHGRLWIADLHADSLLWNRDLLTRHRRGHVDLPRLIAGNVALQVFTVVSKVPVGVSFDSTSDRPDMITPLVVAQRWPRRTWGSLLQRAVYQATKLHRFAAASNGALGIVKSKRDLEAHVRGGARDTRRVAALLGVEGAQVLEGDLTNLTLLFDAGFRLLGLTHFFDTALAGSAHGRHKGGLTPLGRDALDRMGQLGMIVDLAHASPAAIDDVLDVGGPPVIVSHTGVRGTCEGNRNLADRHVRAVADRGGLIGIAYFKYATCGNSVAAIVDAIRYARDLVGAEHVALGSDFDGGVATPFDAAGLVVLTDALLRARFTEAEVTAIMGGNVRRFLMSALPEA